MKCPKNKQKKRFSMKICDECKYAGKRLLNSDGKLIGIKCTAIKEKYYKPVHLGTMTWKTSEKKIFKEAKKYFEREGLHHGKYVLELGQASPLGGTYVHLCHIKDVRYNYCFFEGIISYGELLDILERIKNE